MNVNNAICISTWKNINGDPKMMSLELLFNTVAGTTMSSFQHCHVHMASGINFYSQLAI